MLFRRNSFRFSVLGASPLSISLGVFDSLGWCLRWSSCEDGTRSAEPLMHFWHAKGLCWIAGAQTNSILVRWAKITRLGCVGDGAPAGVGIAGVGCVGQAKDASDGPRRVTAQYIRTVDAAISSRRFWAYAQMLSVLSGFLADLTGWCEGCWCHQQEHSLGSYHMRRRAICFDRQSPSTCPMKGRRAPELAAGVLPQMIDDLANGSVTLLSELTHGLNDKDRTDVFSDWFDVWLQ